MIIAIQIIAVLFALTMIYLTFVFQKKSQFTFKESSFWFALWVAFIILAIVPTALDFFIKGTLGFSRRLDFFIVVGFFFVLGTIFYSYTVIRKTQRKIEEIVRRIAIENKSVPKHVFRDNQEGDKK